MVCDEVTFLNVIMALSIMPQGGRQEIVHTQKLSKDLSTFKSLYDRLWQELPEYHFMLKHYKEVAQRWCKIPTTNNHGCILLPN